MIQRVRTRFYLIVACLCLATPGRADPEADLNRLFDLLKFRETVEIMHLEGMRYGRQVGKDLLSGRDLQDWSGVLARIYDTEKMLTLVSADFRTELSGTDLGPILDYFESNAAQEIVALEISARRMFLDSDVEARAMTAFETLSQDNARLSSQIAEIIDDGDMIEFNVMGTLNASLMFYRGLSAGGAYDVTEEEIFADVWATEDQTREASGEWLGAFMAMAYEPVDPNALKDYAAFYRSPEGQELNRAIFVTFNGMYEEISYLMGLSLAGQMTSVPL